MTEDQRRDGPVFFGRITAGITHEIKNSLAIIKEIAGLQADLLSAAKTGRPLDPDRIAGLAGRITKQVSRADSTVKRLNRFSHTVDRAKKTVDMGEELEFIIIMSKSLIQTKCAKVQTVIPPKPVMVETDPFKLLGALFTCLEAAIEAAGENKEVVVEVIAANGGAIVGFGAKVTNFDLPLNRQNMLNQCLDGLNASVRTPGKDYFLELVF